MKSNTINEAYFSQFLKKNHIGTGFLIVMYTFQDILQHPTEHYLFCYLRFESFFTCWKFVVLYE